MNTAIFLVLILIALAASAFFSGIETGVLSVSNAKITNLAKKGDRRARIVLELLEHPDDFYSIVLVGNNLANVLVSVACTWYFVGVFEDHSRAIMATMLLVMPPLLIFGEIIPKTYYRRRPHMATLASIRLFKACYPVFGPVSRLLMKFVFLLVGRRKEESETQIDVRRHEIQALVREGERMGVVEDDEKDMIEAVFDMSKTTLREVMTPRVAVAALRDDMTPEEVVEFVIGHNYTRFPVYKQTPDHIIGIVHIADILPSGVMTLDNPLPPMYLPDLMHIDDALEKLRTEGRNMAIVVDEYGGTDGIVTIEDLLEEMVGEIEDEFDDEPDDIVLLSPDIWRISALADIHEVLKETGLNLKGISYDAETIGGLVIELTGKIPMPGERVTLDGADITVLVSDSRHIETIQLVMKRGAR